MGRMRQSPADLAVIEGLWASERAQILAFAEKFNDGKVVGARRSDAQQAVCDCAKAKGYRIKWVTKVAHELHMGLCVDGLMAEIRLAMGVFP